MTRRHMTCQELIDLVTDYLEGDLPQPERARFEDHVAGCDGCRLAVEQFRLTVRTIGRVDEDEVPAPLREALLSAFRAWRPAPGS